MGSTEESGDPELPPEVRALLLEHVDSFEQLDLLLLLHRERDADWTAAELCDRLRIPRAVVDASLGLLCMRGLVRQRPARKPAAFVYAPASSGLDQAVSRLATAYSERPVSVIRLMSSNAIQRMRSGAFRAFSEAFLLRGSQDDE